MEKWGEPSKIGGNQRLCEGIWGVEIPELPIPGVGCRDMVPTPGAQRGLVTLSQPRCVSGAIYKLELHKVGTGFVGFFFTWLYQISEKREREPSLGHPVCGFFIWAGSLDREAATGTAAGAEPGMSSLWKGRADLSLGTNPALKPGIWSWDMQREPPGLSRPAPLSHLSPRLCPGRGKVLLDAGESSPGEGKLPPTSSPPTATSVWG